MDEGFKFSSSLYLLLIWVRVLRFVFENPSKISEHMVNVPFFHEFQKSPTCENYIDALVNSMAGLSMSAPPTPASAKRRLVDIQDSEEEEDVVQRPKKRIRKQRRQNTCSNVLRRCLKK